MCATRVGLVCGYLDPTRDGVADYTGRLAASLRPAGVDPLILTTHRWARAAGSGVVGVTDRWDVRGVSAAARSMRQLRLDVVHVQFAPSAFGSSRAVGLLPVILPRDIPLIVTLHEYGVWSGHGRGRPIRSSLWSAAERHGYADRETLLLTPRADRLLVSSAEHLQVLHHRFRRQPAALEVPIGLNVDVATGDRRQARVDVRRELGAAPDAPLVVFFGFLHPEKGLDRLIAAVADLREHLPGAELLLIGGAESHSVPADDARRLRRELEQVAATHNFGDGVHFSGYQPAEEVSRLLQAADAGAFPFNAGVTRKSSSLLAALAAGIPVVATAPAGVVTGPTEDDGVLLVPPRDTVALTCALRQVLSDRALADRMKAAARVRVAGQDWADIAAVHAAVYTRAAASHRRGRPWTRAAHPSSVGTSTTMEGVRGVDA